MTQCTRCGTREAFYIKRDSGERLCIRCLYRSVERDIARGLSKYSSAGREETILYLDPLLPHIWDRLVLRLLKRITARHKNRLVVLTHSWKTYLYRDEVSLEDTLTTDPVEMLRCCERFRDYPELIVCIQKSLLLRGLITAMNTGIKRILMPCPRTSLYIKGIYSLLYSVRELVSETLPTRTLLEIEISNPLYETPTEDLVALSMVVDKESIPLVQKSLEELLSILENPYREAIERCIDDEILGDFMRIAYLSRELIYTTPIGVERYFSRYPGRCVLCGAPLPDVSARYCRYCSALLSCLESLSEPLG